MSSVELNNLYSTIANDLNDQVKSIASQLDESVENVTNRVKESLNEKAEEILADVETLRSHQLSALEKSLDVVRSEHKLEEEMEILMKKSILDVDLNEYSALVLQAEKLELEVARVEALRTRKCGDKIIFLSESLESDENRIKHFRDHTMLGWLECGSDQLLSSVAPDSSETRNSDDEFNSDNDEDEFTADISLLELPADMLLLNHLKLSDCEIQQVCGACSIPNVPSFLLLDNRSFITVFKCVGRKIKLSLKLSVYNPELPEQRIYFHGDMTASEKSLFITEEKQLSILEIEIPNEIPHSAAVKMRQSVRNAKIIISSSDKSIHFRGLYFDAGQQILYTMKGETVQGYSQGKLGWTVVFEHRFDEPYRLLARSEIFGFLFTNGNGKMATAYKDVDDDTYETHEIENFSTENFSNVACGSVSVIGDVGKTFLFAANNEIGSVAVVSFEHLDEHDIGVRNWELKAVVDMEKKRSLSFKPSVILSLPENWNAYLPEMSVAAVVDENTNSIMLLQFPLEY